jgi:hypothetical protein
MFTITKDNVDIITDMNKNNQFQHAGRIYVPLTQTSNFLVTVNSSVNFVIYCIFGEKFKRIFLKAMCVLLGKENYSPPGELIRYPNNNSFVSEMGTNSLYRTRSVLIHRGSLTPPASLLGRSNTLRVPGRSHSGSFSHLLRLSLHSDGDASPLPSRSSSQECVHNVHNHLTVPHRIGQHEGFRLRGGGGGGGGGGGPGEIIVQTSRRKTGTEVYYKDIPLIYTSMV